MRILIDSYNTSFQNRSGGVQNRINNYMKALFDNNIEAKLYNKWTDKISDYDILHVFKLGLDHFEITRYSKQLNIPVIVSSILPDQDRLRILVNSFLRMFHLCTSPLYSIIKEELELSDCVMTETRKERAFIIRNYGIKGNKIVSLPNGVDTSHINTSPSLFADKYGIKSKYLLQVGLVEPNKNQFNVIRAINDLDIDFVIIGGPSRLNPYYFDKCRRIARKNVHFIGWIDNNDELLWSAYCGSQATILPSRKEIFGNSIVEAGCCGSNLIKSKELELTEYGLDRYFIDIDPEDINDIRKKIEYAMKKDKSPSQQADFIRVFGWGNVMKRYIEVYKRILER